ncbi:MAG: hypothetical protein K0R34_1942, partial [Herbinix sp.]|nr:hypothetical protein [Herbinix sp.]
MIVNTINSMENEFENGLKYAAPLSIYYSKLIDTESINSFDMFYVILQLIDDLNNVVYCDNTNF